VSAIVSAEVRKLCTVRSTWLLLAVAQVILLVGLSGVMLNRDDVASPAVQQSAVAHLGLVSLFSLVLGITAVAGEYRHRTITDAYLAVPQRQRVVWAKLVVYTGTGAIFGGVAAVVAVGASAIWLAARDASLAVGSGDVT
jgi:ABC-2 type transport system permease protein